MTRTAPSRLLVHVEGQTEEMFVNELISPHLREGFGWTTVRARLMGNARKKSHRGGVRAWSSVRTEVVSNLREDRGLTIALMVDYYRMPSTGKGAWPGRKRASDGKYPDNGKNVEKCLSDDIAMKMGSNFDRKRFVPYVVMHEFEALLFSDCDAFGQGIDRPDLSGELRKIRDRFRNPEKINDSPDGAPSKRLKRLIRGYEKPLYGNVAALEIGIETMRSECPRFKDWLRRLERVPAAGSQGA